MSGLCKDCKHWQPLPWLVQERRERPGVCRLIRDTTGGSTRAGIALTENASASLTTAPDFGCVEFEARER